MSTLRVAFPALSNPANNHRATALTPEQFHNATRAPLLLIAGGKDHIAPASVTRANFNLYKRSKAVTDYKEFPERSHYTLGQNGWEEVADYALDWALDRAVARPRAALADVQRPEAPADSAPLARSFRDSVVHDTAGQTPERPEERPS